MVAGVAVVVEVLVVVVVVIVGCRNVGCCVAVWGGKGFCEVFRGLFLICWLTCWVIGSWSDSSESVSVSLSLLSLSSERCRASPSIGCPSESRMS